MCALLQVRNDSEINKLSSMKFSPPCLSRASSVSLPENMSTPSPSKDPIEVIDISDTSPEEFQETNIDCDFAMNKIRSSDSNSNFTSTDLNVNLRPSSPPPLIPMNCSPSYVQEDEDESSCVGDELKFRPQGGRSFRGATGGLTLKEEEEELKFTYEPQQKYNYAFCKNQKLNFIDLPPELLHQSYNHQIITSLPHEIPHQQIAMNQQKFSNSSIVNNVIHSDNNDSCNCDESTDENWDCSGCSSNEGEFQEYQISKNYKKVQPKVLRRPSSAFLYRI